MQSFSAAVALCSLALLAGCQPRNGDGTTSIEPKKPCIYAGQEYSTGSWMCQEGTKMTCGDGIWLQRGECAKPCEKPPADGSLKVP